MTAQEAISILNSYATINQGGLTVNVRITDVKQSYGVIRYQVTPISGFGSIWVDATRVNLGEYKPELQS